MHKSNKQSTTNNPKLDINSSIAAINKTGENREHLTSYL
jgi:hypothetical protein